MSSSSSNIRPRVDICFSVLSLPTFRPVLQETPFPRGKEVEEENVCVGADGCRGGQAPELGLVLSCVVTGSVAFLVPRPFLSAFSSSGCG